MQMWQGLAIAVPTFKRNGMLAGLLRSIEAQSVLPSLVLVLDNNPRADARGIVEEFSASSTISVAYLPLGANTGPAGAFSRALTHLSGVDGIEWMMCRGDDNPFRDPDTVAEMKDFAETVAALGAVGVGNRGVVFEKRRGYAVPLASDDAQSSPWVRADALPGGGSPTYRIAEVLSAGANFDPFLFFGYEELDMGMQLTNAGLPLFVNTAGQKRLRQQFGKTEGPELIAAPWRTYFHYRNLLIVGRRYGTIGGAGLLVLKSVARAALVAAKGGSWPLICAQMSGILDGALNRPPRPSYIPK